MAVGLERENTINQQERVAVGQLAHDGLDIESGGLSLGAGGFRATGWGSTLLEQTARERMVGLVTGALGKNKPFQIEAQEREGSDQVEHFGSGALLVVTGGVFLQT